MNEIQKRLAFSYLRFSRAEQKHGNSTKRQTDLRETYCQRHGLLLDSSRMISDEGISGYHGRNSVEGSLGEFLLQIQSGQIPPGSVLILESMDRLSRDQIRNARNRLEAILEAGVDVHTISPEHVYTKDSLSKPEELTSMVWEFARAFEFSRQLGTRVSSAWSAKRDLARAQQVPLSKRPPAWLKVTNGQYQVDQARGAVVNQVYELCVDGMGIHLIAKTLNRQRVPTFAWKNTGKIWTETYIRKLLEGEAPIGHHQPTRIDPVTRKQIPTPKIENLYPAVISETLNAQAKMALRQRKNKGGRVDLDGRIHPFSGLLRTHSGFPVRVKYLSMSRKTSTLTAYLRDMETGHSYPLQRFEVLMLVWMTNLDHKPEPLRPPSAEIPTLQERITELDHQVQVFSEKISQGESFDSFLKLLSQAETERKLARKRLEELQALAPVGQGLQALSSVIERLGPLSPDHLLNRPREVNLALRAALRRVVTGIELTMGTEGRTWQKKSLRVTVTFKDRVQVAFTYRPLQ